MAEKKKPGKEGGKSTLKMLVIIILALTVSCGVAFYVVTLLHKDKKPETSLVNVRLKKELIDFTYTVMPNLYNSLETLNSEIIMIDTEVERLNQMTEQFPRQAQIIVTEKNSWIQIRKNLSISLSNLEKNIEIIYVSYLVNKTSGLELIKEKQDELKRSVEETLSSSQESTNRLKPKEKTFFEKIKEKF